MLYIGAHQPSIGKVGISEEMDVVSWYHLTSSSNINSPIWPYPIVSKQSESNDQNGSSEGPHTLSWTPFLTVVGMDKSICYIHIALYVSCNM